MTNSIVHKNYSRLSLSNLDLFVPALRLSNDEELKACGIQLKDIITVLKEILIENNSIISGGFARSCLLKFESIDTNFYTKQIDIDVYSEVKSATKNAAELFCDRLNEMFKSSKARYIPTAIIKNSFTNSAINVEINAATCDNRWKLNSILVVQFITSFVGDYKVIHESFDFENVQVSITKDGMIFNENFIELETNKQLSLYCDRSSYLLARLKKYTEQRDLVPTEKTIIKIEKNLEQYADIFFNSTLQFLEKSRLGELGPEAKQKYIKYSTETYGVNEPQVYAALRTYTHLCSLKKYLSDITILKTFVPWYSLLLPAMQEKKYHLQNPYSIIKDRNEKRNRNTCTNTADIFPDGEYNYLTNLPPVSRAIV